jgi:DNA topoisomerase-1
MSLHTVNIDRDQARLYDLIWKRTLASQMSDAQLERTNVKIEEITMSCLQHRAKYCF